MLFLFPGTSFPTQSAWLLTHLSRLCSNILSSELSSLQAQKSSSPNCSYPISTHWILFSLLNYIIIIPKYNWSVSSVRKHQICCLVLLLFLQVFKAGWLLLTTHLLNSFPSFLLIELEFLCEASWRLALDLQLLIRLCGGKQEYLPPISQMEI